MLKSYLLTLYRSLVKHRLFSALNIFGLAVGMAVFLVLTIATQFELSYDRWIPNSERTYRIGGVMNIPGRTAETIAVIPGPVLPNLQAETNEIEAAVRVLSPTLAVRRGEQSDYESVQFADSTFFDVFDLPLASGSKQGTIADTSSLVISEAMARKYFGRTEVVGERITLTTDGTQRDYRISAVLRDLPENTHLKLDFLAKLDEAVLPETAEYLDEWNATNYATYIRLKSASAAAGLDALFPDFMKRRAGDVATWFGLKLEPLPDVHFNTSVIGTMKPGADRKFVTMLQVVGILTLLLAVINYINLSTARATLRAREVALRKVFGATRGALVGQFLIEAVIVSLLAALIAVAIVELTLPLANVALGGHLKLDYSGADGILPAFVGITALVGLAAGFYPAMVISRFQPASVLAASRAPGGGRAAGLLREVLVVAQFAISIALLVCTAVVLSQANFLRNTDLGFKRDHLIVVEQVGNPQVAPSRNTIQDAFRRLPGVQSVTLSGRFPGAGGVARSESFSREGMPAQQGSSIAWQPIGPGYFDTYGMRLLAGRFFDSRQGLDESPDLRSPEMQTRGANVILNESALKELRFANAREAIGKTIRPGNGAPLRVVGVVENARFGPPREKVPPVLHILYSTPDKQMTGYETITLRYRGDSQQMLGRLEQAWKQIVPNIPFEARTVETSLATFYEGDEQRSRLITLGAIVAAVIGCLGLYGLAAFASERRTREIGIRKVLGASTGDVFRLLLGQFLRPVVIANLIAWPVAFLLMREWLNGFDQRIGLSPWYFLAATALALLVAFLTVTGQAMRVARADPGKALRDE